MKETVGIGFIGTGFARRVQMPAFAACAGARIVSVSSANLENARSAAEEFGAAHFTVDWQKTISHPNVDLVCITTPPNLHLEMALNAVDQGKHILCEKPMAMNAAEAEEMTRAAADRPILALIDHELRFQPGRQIARKMLRDGAIGRVRHAKAIFQAPHRGSPDIRWNWWSDREAGGGALGAIGSHIIDSFRWFLGSPISTLTCQLQSHIKTRIDQAGTARVVTTDDEANLLLRFADAEITDDATGLVSISMLEYPRYQNRLEFYGSEGALRIDHRGDVFITGAEPGEWREVEVEIADSVPDYGDTGFPRGFVKFAPKIIEAIGKGERVIENAATFADGLYVQKVLDAARASSDRGCSFSIEV